MMNFSTQKAMANYGKHENVVIINGLSGASKWNFKRVYFISRLIDRRWTQSSRTIRACSREQPERVFLAIRKVKNFFLILFKPELYKNKIN